MSVGEGVAPPAEEVSVDTIGRKAGRGLRWSVAGTVATKVGSFATGLVLARLLAPADFGVFAVAMAATYFMMHVNDVGLIAAGVQWRGRFEDMVPTGTILAVAFSVACYAACWFFAPAFAELAGSPGATPLVRLLTSVILIDGITAIRVAALQRRFQQDRLVTANFAGFVVQAAVSVTLAVHGEGAFSFAVGQVAGASVTGGVILVLAKVSPTLGFDRAIAVRLLRFGAPLAASLGVEAVLMNADYVIVGRLLGPTALGFYLLAFNVSNWVPGVIGMAVRYVSVAGFSRLSEGVGEPAHGVQRAIPLMVAFVLPVGVVMGVLAPALVQILYGDQWLPSAGVLRFLAVLMVVRMVSGLAFDVLVGAGAITRAFWLAVGWTVALVPALVWGTELGGIQGTAVAHAVVALLVAGPLVALSLRGLGIRLAPIGLAAIRPLCGGCLAAVACLAVARATDFSPLLELLTAGTAALVTYLVVALTPTQLRHLATRVRHPARAAGSSNTEEAR
jgi:O-antigen/teichoic acid export membrane protein